MDKNAPSSVGDHPPAEQLQIDTSANQQVETKSQEQNRDSNTDVDGKPKLLCDPSIELDGDTQEMKEVLAKTNLTEVVSPLGLDSRLKSPSVSSLTSRSDLSDSYVSVASGISNGHIKRSGSLSSVGSLHSQVGHSSNLVRVRSASGRPLSDTVSFKGILSKINKLHAP